MQIRLVEQEQEWKISYPNEQTNEREAAILKVLRGPNSRTFLAQLSARFPRFLLDGLEGTAVAASSRQIEFAGCISRALGIPIPPDAFHNRDLMWAFIDQYVGLFPCEHRPRWLSRALARRASKRRNSP